MASSSASAAAARTYIESTSGKYPALADSLNALLDLYDKKLWHQLTLETETLLAEPAFTSCPSDVQIDLYQSFIKDFAYKYASRFLIANHQTRLLFQRNTHQPFPSLTHAHKQTNLDSRL